VTTFLIRRFGASLLVLAVVVTMSFLILRLVPGDPVQLMLGNLATPANVALVRHNLGLDSSLLHQYVSFVPRALRLDFGTSIVRRTPSRTLIVSHLAPSIYLIVYAGLIAVLISIPLGVYSAVKRNRPADHLIRLSSMVVFAMPSFWLGIMLLLFFGLKLGLLPVSGYGSGVLGVLASLTLPALTLGLHLAPPLTRTLRASLLEALDSEYVEALRSYGFSEVRVVVKHALRNSLIAFVTVLSISVGFLISGSVVVENVFQIPGLGSLLVQSVLSRDYPVIQGLVVVFGILVIAINLIADLAYAAIDPRVRLDGNS
jgi:peptide/nickel transport system permease protein